MVQEPSRHVRLIRTYNDDNQGTSGALVFPDGTALHTLELPWKDNKPKLSCIPEGAYDVIPVRSPRFGDCYCVRNVPGRSYILIHSGNYAGAIPHYKTHVQGCILLGERLGVMAGQRAVLTSRAAVRTLWRIMKGNPFQLEVTSVNGDLSNS